MHVTIVDDEKILSSLIARKLEQLQYQVKMYHSFHAFSEHDTGETDMYLLDVSLWDGHGFDIIRKLRAHGKTKNTPIIMMSGHDEVPLKIQGLNLGADDYIVKPFDSNELLARIWSLTRRREREVQVGDILYKNFRFDPITREIYLGEEKIKLLKKEKQLFEMFIYAEWQMIPKDEIARKVWGQSLNPVLENTITVTICTLRKKLGQRFQLETRVGEGYILHQH